MPPSVSGLFTTSIPSRSRVNPGASARAFPRKSQHGGPVQYLRPPGTISSGLAALLGWCVPEVLDFSNDPLKKGAFCIKIRNLFKISSKLGSAGSQILRPFLRDSNHHAESETVGMVIVMTMIFSSRCSSLYFKRSVPPQREWCGNIRISPVISRGDYVGRLDLQAGC